MAESSEVIEKLRDGIIQIGMAVGVHDASSVEQILEDVGAIKGRAEKAEVRADDLAEQRTEREQECAALREQIATLTQERDSLLEDAGQHCENWRVKAGHLEMERDAHAKTIEELREALAGVMPFVGGDPEFSCGEYDRYNTALNVAKAALRASTTEQEPKRESKS